MACRVVPVGVLLWLAVTATAACAEPAKAITVELDAGQYDRQGVPVFFELPGSLWACTALELVRLDSGDPVAVQIDAGPPARAVWMIGDRLAAGSVRRYRLAPAQESAKGPAAVSATDDGKKLTISVGGRSVLAYNYAVVPCPDRQQPWFDRSGFIHPVTSPAGQVLTDDMPPDHYHQHGIMLAWVNTTFEGRHVDFWNSKQQQGKVEHVKLSRVVEGPVFAGFTAGLAHIDLTAPGGPKTALEETWQVRVYDRADAFLFDLASTQRCATESPLVINEYHYGGMCFRGARAWFDQQSGDFLTSEGESRADGNHTRPCWVDAYGKQEGGTAGVTVFCWPENSRAPQPVRLHPQKPYFCWAPMVLGPFAIEPGAPYVSKYRYYVHDGPLDPRQAEALWHALAEPPVVRAVGE